jgi:hypothetical protein
MEHARISVSAAPPPNRARSGQPVLHRGQQIRANRPTAASARTAANRGMVESQEFRALRGAMTSRDRHADDTVKQRSGWLIPLAVFVVTAVLSAFFLLFYLAPAPTSFIEEHQSPTSRTDPVRISLGGFSLQIPANYLLYASARQGGDRKQIELFAKFPDFQGYSDWEAQTFNGNGPDSPIIYMLIREEPFNLGEEERLRRIYLNYVADAQGKPGPFELTEYMFRDDSGYRREDLFVGDMRGQPVVMRCVRFSQEVPSPSCLRDVRLSNAVVLSYRFKRALLANWREIATGVNDLVHGFAAKAK